MRLGPLERHSDALFLARKVAVEPRFVDLFIVHRSSCLPACGGEDHSPLKGGWRSCSPQKPPGIPIRLRAPWAPVAAAAKICPRIDVDSFSVISVGLRLEIRLRNKKNCKLTKIFVIDFFQTRFARLNNMSASELTIRVRLYVPQG